MSDDIVTDPPAMLLSDLIKKKAPVQNDSETFEEMCKRLGLNPHCVCDFGTKECGT